MTDRQRNMRYWLIAIPVAMVVMFILTGAAFVLADQLRGGPSSRTAIHHIDTVDDFTHARAVRSDCITSVNQEFYLVLTELIITGKRSDPRLAVIRARQKAIVDNDPVELRAVGLSACIPPKG